MTVLAALDGHGDDGLHMSRIEVPVRARTTHTTRIGCISSLPRLTACRVNAIDHLPSKLDTALATLVAGDSPNGLQQLVPLSHLSRGKSLSILGQALVCFNGTSYYEGRSSGVSVPVGHVRYRVGASQGHYVQGAPVTTAIDTGTLHITNKRVVFQGKKQTGECSFAKLIGFQHDDAAGTTTFSVSNRQKPTTVHYGPKLSGAFQFRLDLALAHYRGTVTELKDRLTKEANAIMAEHPVRPSDAANAR